ncbi:MAG: hypothetical protein HW393_385 [Dehalococcoidia bacterium]|nr:hypothetical protein [Dehalococcoidia bacterium]
MVSEEVVLEALREVYDPELHYNIVDLGLVYDVDIKDGDVHVLMTLTTPACPIGPMISEQIQELLGLMPGVKDIDVEFTFDPAWGPDMMTDEARADLDLDRDDLRPDPLEESARDPRRHRLSRRKDARRGKGYKAYRFRERYQASQALGSSPRFEPTIVESACTIATRSVLVERTRASRTAPSVRTPIWGSAITAPWATSTS